MLKDKIDIGQLKEEVFDLDELVRELKEELKENVILINTTIVGSCMSSKGISNGTFEDNLWVLKDTLKEVYIYLMFSKLETMKFKGVTDNDIILIKCWILENIIDLHFEYEGRSEFRSLERHRNRLNNLISFIEASSNFHIDFLDKTKGSRIRSFIFNTKVGEYGKQFMIETIILYLNYIQDKVPEERLDTLSQYIIELNMMLKEFKLETEPRQIPSSKDILLFSNYIDIFFNDKNIKEELKLYYAPILIWWKITIIIPMRPSEFTRKMKRDSPFQDGESYYLKIDRIKKPANPKYKFLPVLNRVKITKELFNLINEYIIKTNKYGYSETLISYRAVCGLRKEISRLYPKIRIRWNDHNNLFKINASVFTLKIFNDMLIDFYYTVIEGIYKDTYIKERLRPGDTRHIAFTSLMLQGYSPIEIAIIGGHRTLSALYNYTCSVNSYIDSEVFRIITKNINIATKDYSELIKIVFNKSIECPVSLNKCIEADIDGKELGYCTANFKENSYPCEHDDCYRCSKWWCKPNEYNLLKLESIVKKKLSKKDNKLQRDLDFLVSLLKDVGFEIIDGKLVLDNNISQGLKRISLELNSNTKSIIDLKTKLVSPNKDTYRLLSDIEELLPTKEFTKELNKIIKTKVKQTCKGK